MPPQELAARIREWGSELGFNRIGLAAAREPAGSRRLLEWLSLGYHGSMSWMARDPEKRLDPEKILPGARSVVVAALNYRHPGPTLPREGIGRISSYAWGDDYHEVMGEKLEALEARIREAQPGVRSRRACDTSPVMDKAWAVAAGIGWQGKNTCLIHPENGSWFFLGEIFLDLVLPPDPPVLDHCAGCTRCLEACPTGALVGPYRLDSRRCISYLTIESRGPFAPEEASADGTLDPARAIGDWLAGCDVCQEVCPWNRPAPVSDEERFKPQPDLTDRRLEEWLELSDDQIRKHLKRSSLSRIKPPDLRRNAAAVRDNQTSRR